MRTLRITGSALLLISMSANVFAAQDAPDVQTIVEKANIAAYYQADDGKATVKMVITSEGGQKRQREFNILRKDVKDGGDQKYFVYFNKPADVRRMTYMVHKHAAIDKDDDKDRLLLKPAPPRGLRLHFAGIWGALGAGLGGDGALPWTRQRRSTGRLVLSGSSVMTRSLGRQCPWGASSLRRTITL